MAFEKVLFTGVDGESSTVERACNAGPVAEGRGNALYFAKKASRHFGQKANWYTVYLWAFSAAEISVLL